MCDRVMAASEGREFSDELEKLAVGLAATKEKTRRALEDERRQQRQEELRATQLRERQEKQKERRQEAQRQKELAAKAKQDAAAKAKQDAAKKAQGAAKGEKRSSSQPVQRRKKAKGAAVIIPSGASDAWIEKRIASGLIPGPPSGPLLYGANGLAPFVTGQYMSLSYMRQRPLQCGHAALINGCCRTLEELGIEYGEQQHCDTLT